MSYNLIVPSCDSDDDDDGGPASWFGSLNGVRIHYAYKVALFCGHAAGLLA